MEMMTIKQAAEALGISKTALRKRLTGKGLMDKCTRDPGPKGTILIPDEVLALLDTEHPVTDNQKPETENAQGVEHVSNKTEHVSENIEHVSGVQTPLDTANVSGQFMALLVQVSGQLQTMDTMQDTINRQAKTIEQQAQTIAELMEKNRKLEAQAEPQTKAVPTDPEGAARKPWWKRWFT